MWTPKTSNKSNSNRVDVNERTYMTPYSTPSVPSTAASNESSGNNKGLNNNFHRSFSPYFPGSYASTSSTNNVGLPSGIQQTQGGSSSMRNTLHVLTNETSQMQLSLGSSHGYSGITKTCGPPLIPNKPPLVPNRGHTGRIANSIGGFVSADGSGSSSTGLANVPSPVSGLNLSASCMSPIPGNSHFGDPMPLPQNQFQDETSHFTYMGLLNDSNDDDINVDVNDLRNLFGYYYSAGDLQGQPGLKRTDNFSFFQHNQYFGIPNEEFSPWSTYEGGLNVGGLVDYSATQRHKEHLVEPQQYPMGRSPGFMLGAINASHYPLQQEHDSSINGTGFSFTRPGNQDLHFHGSEQYQHFQQSQPQPRFYNPLRSKEGAQGSLLGPDDHGLLGLLKIIKGANPAKISLAMGVDPHSLGLDLNSLEPIHQKFASPWSDEPVKEGPKYDIPYCYNSKQPPPLKLSHFKKFHLAMLFYIFYSMPQDQAQLFAANELHVRGWYFHKELHMWFSRDKNSVPTLKNATYEVGCYICFDPSTWQTIRQVSNIESRVASEGVSEFVLSARVSISLPTLISRENVVLYYKMIERRPAIPL